MDNITLKIKKIKTDALYGKKKHFNAADKKEKWHYSIGIPLIIVNILSSSILFYIITEDAVDWLKYVPLVLGLITALLTGFQTFLNLQKKVEGHRRVGNRYLGVYKKCDIILAYIADDVITQNSLIETIENVTLAIEDINKEAESFPTSQSDYIKAKIGINSGEESYNENELEI
ncbi:SLATT domain-containing protein [Hyunsoonleella flava]|uniref:SLATT domain-containing protein n=1 Tax=Hyunsoonleella flava TaxID=2527939 RepID=A0A4Q9FL48_9FLAO|nr:SLATT domain-containing protein [Hyunsoonleella flava]TBN06357.1 SLATT domain-containing protein [Hyunsoonleella flava]